MSNKIAYIFPIVVCGLAVSVFAIINLINKHFIQLPEYGKENHVVSNFEFKDQNDQLLKSVELDGKIWVVNYFFTSCPSICPKMMKNLQEVHDIVRNDDEIVLLSFTVDPTRDTPSRLKRYISNYNVNEKSWRLLTGNKADLYRLARKSFLISATEGNGGQNDFIHSENIVVVDNRRKIRNIINGIDPKADRKILDTINKLRA